MLYRFVRMKAAKPKAAWLTPSVLKHLKRGDVFRPMLIQDDI
jgi:hypothetical protein